MMIQNAGKGRSLILKVKVIPIPVAYNVVLLHAMLTYVSQHHYVNPTRAQCGSFLVIITKEALNLCMLINLQIGYL